MDAPMPMAASVLVMMSLVHMECPPSGPEDKTQQRASSSSIPQRAKKPSPTVAAMSRPTAAAGTEVTSGRPDAAMLLPAANQSTNVAGRRTMVTSDRVEKLARNERRPRAARRPPRTPRSRALDAMRASRYGEA